MTNTMRKVMMVVAVLITSCQVSLKSNRGPVTTQTTMTPTARVKVIGRPLARALTLVNCEYQALRFICLFHARLGKRSIHLDFLSSATTKLTGPRQHCAIAAALRRLNPGNPVSRKPGWTLHEASDCPETGDRLAPSPEMRRPHRAELSYKRRF